MSDELLATLSDGTLKITFNRPHKKNAITYPMYRDLQRHLKNAESDPNIHVVIFTGVGEIFTAGNDIASFRDGVDLAYNEKPSFQFMNTLATFSKPVIGALNGDAVGIGATMLFHFDLLYCAEGVNIKMPFLSLGVVPEFASSLLLPMLAGHTKAFEIFTLRQGLSCEEALALNLVNAVLPAGELMPFVDGRAKQLASHSPAAVQATKKLMKDPVRQKIIEVIDTETVSFTERLRSPEVQAVFAAFLNKD